MKRKIQKQNECRQILTLQIQRISIEQKNQKFKKKLRFITTKSKFSKFSNIKRMHSNNDVKFMKTKKKFKIQNFSKIQRRKTQFRKF